MTFVGFGGLFAIIVICGLSLAFAALIVRTGVWKWMLAGVLVLGGIAVFSTVVAIALPAAFRAGRTHSSNSLIEHRTPTVVLQSAVDVSNTKVSVNMMGLETWSKADHWPASVYSSIERAGRALADQVAEYLVDHRDDLFDVVQVEVVEPTAETAGQKNQHELRQLVGLDDALRGKGLTDVKVQYVDGTGELDTRRASPAAKCALVRLSLANEDSERGRLSASIEVPEQAAGENRFEVRWVDKAWVRQEGDANRGGHQYLIGRSDLQPSAEKAIAGATADAVQRISALIEAEVQNRKLSPADRVDVRRRISEVAAQFVDRRCSDRFSQQLQSRHVRVHRAAILVPAAGVDLRKLTDELLGRTRTARKGFFHQILAATTLGAFIFLAYLFLNAGTKGHFAWKLRSLCAALYGALCWAIYHFGVFA